MCQLGVLSVDCLVYEIPFCNNHSDILTVSQLKKIQAFLRVIFVDFSTPENFVFRKKERKKRKYLLCQNCEISCQTILHVHCRTGEELNR